MVDPAREPLLRFEVHTTVKIKWVYMEFTSIQSWVHVFEIREAGLAAVAPMLSPNEIWAMIGVPIAARVPAIMVGL